MLDAACAGEVFTSPVPEQMLAATKLVDGGAGVVQGEMEGLGAAAARQPIPPERPRQRGGGGHER